MINDHIIVRSHLIDLKTHFVVSVI